ncbi:MAG: hypothetical protein R3C42_04090 [Parvularculaceae bacterium]|nr:hypothetical protein [Parvularculaceae bacterium]
MTADRIKTVVSLLLITNGALHLLVAGFGAPPRLAVPIAIFGAVYGGLGVRLSTGGRTIMRLAMAAAFAGIVLGGANFVINGGEFSLALMFAFDIAVLAFGGVWLARTRKSS